MRYAVSGSSLPSDLVSPFGSAFATASGPSSASSCGRSLRRCGLRGFRFLRCFGFAPSASRSCSAFLRFCFLGGDARLLCLLGFCFLGGDARGLRLLRPAQCAQPPPSSLALCARPPPSWFLGLLLLLAMRAASCFAVSAFAGSACFACSFSAAIRSARPSGRRFLRFDLLRVGFRRRGLFGFRWFGGVLAAPRQPRPSRLPPSPRPSLAPAAFRPRAGAPVAAPAAD